MSKRSIKLLLRLTGKMTGADDSRPGSYVAVDEEYFQHSGLRGCRGCCLCTLLVILLIVGLVNAAVTAGLVYLLSITHEGMASAEFFPGGKYVRVLSDVHFDKVTLHDGLNARQATENETLIISGSQILLGGTDGSTVLIDGNGTVLTTNELELATKPLLSSKIPLNFDLYQVSNLHTSQLDVGSISTRAGISGLVVEANEGIEVRGMEGVNIGSKGNLDVLTLNGDIAINTEGDLVLDGFDGIRLSPDLPVDGKGAEVKSDSGQYKLCVCGGTGKLFAVPITDKDSGCHRANEDMNPCLD